MPKGTSRNASPNEEGIYIEFKPVAITGVEVSDYLHSYLVYEDGKGNAEVIRGGFPATAPFGGDITVQSGIPLQQSEDAYKPGETPESRIRTKIDLNGRHPKVMRDKFKKTAQEIGRAKIDYDGLPKDQNSNSLIRAVLERNGVDPQKVIPANIPKDRLRGYENNLSNPYDNFDRMREMLFDNPIDSKKGGTPDGDKAEQPPQSDPGKADVKGSSGKDSLSDRESAQPDYAPEIKNFLEDLKKSDDPVS